MEHSTEIIERIAGAWKCAIEDLRGLPAISDPQTISTAPTKGLLGSHAVSAAIPSMVPDRPRLRRPQQMKRLPWQHARFGRRFRGVLLFLCARGHKTRNPAGAGRRGRRDRKPSSVAHPVARGAPAVIPLGRASPRASSGQPEGSSGQPFSAGGFPFRVARPRSPFLMRPLPPGWGFLPGPPLRYRRAAGGGSLPPPFSTLWPAPPALRSERR